MSESQSDFSKCFEFFVQSQPKNGGRRFGKIDWLLRYGIMRTFRDGRTIVKEDPVKIVFGFSIAIMQMITCHRVHRLGYSRRIKRISILVDVREALQKNPPSTRIAVFIELFLGLKHETPRLGILLMSEVRTAEG